MAKTIDIIKEWAKENVRMMDMLPPTTNGSITVRLSDILEKEVDEKFYLSKEKADSLMFKIDDKKDSDIKVVGSLKGNFRSSNEVLSKDGISTCLNTMTGGGREPKVMLEEATIIDDTQGFDGVREYKIASTLRSERSGLKVKEATKQGYALATEGDSVNLQYPESKTRRGRVGNQIANTIQATGDSNQGVVIDDTQTGFNGVREYKNIAPTLRSSRNGLKTYDNYRIRKLTPKECWRLQSFPDSAFDKAEKVNSNSQLYKQAGNSVTVNVIKEIAAKL